MRIIQPKIAKIRFGANAQNRPKTVEKSPTISHPSRVSEQVTSGWHRGFYDDRVQINVKQKASGDKYRRKRSSNKAVAAIQL